MSEDIASNIEFKPVIIGIFVSLVIMGMTIEAFGNNFLCIFGLIIGSAIAGFLTNNSTKYALIYGAVVGIIGGHMMLSISIPVHIIIGLFGGFVGKIVQSNIE